MKFLISQKPNMAKVLCPAIIGFKSPPLLIFDAIIFDPASPNPKASRCPILTIAFSRAAVSYCAFSSGLPFFPFNYCIIESTPALSTSSDAAARGSLEISLTFSNMRSMGFSTSLFASSEKNIDAIVSTMHTKIVRAILRADYI